MINGPAGTLRRARKLRSEMTLPEAMLWRELRQRPRGFKFRRQHPAGAFVLDFYCAAARLAVEVDGWAHDNAQAAKADASRSRFLRAQGIATTRVPAQAVIDDTQAVVIRLVEICQQRCANPPPPGEGDHPQGGGGAPSGAPDLKGFEHPSVPHHHALHGPPPRAGEDWA